MKISGDERSYSFYYDADGKGWTALRLNDDGRILSTEVAGGFVGAVVGLHARLEEADANQPAAVSAVDIEQLDGGASENERE
jgi:alpha-N-arabinofuranosidase